MFTTSQSSRINQHSMGFRLIPRVPPIDAIVLEKGCIFRQDYDSRRSKAWRMAKKKRGGVMLDGKRVKSLVYHGLNVPLFKFFFAILFCIML